MSSNSPSLQSTDIVVPRSFEDHTSLSNSNQKNSVQFPSPPDSADSPSYHQPPAPLPSSAALIDKYLSAYSNTASSQLNQQNTIEFPLASAPLKRKADVLSGPCRMLSEPVRAMHRWLLRTYEPDESSVVPEMDVRVKYKGLWDRLERGAMASSGAIEPVELVKQVFPDVVQDIRVLEGTIRSNEEHVLRGIRFRKRANADSLSELDLRNSIPIELHSSELIEALRERVNELEDELEFETEVNKRARLMSARRDSDELTRQTGSSTFTIDAQSDHSTIATSVHSIDSAPVGLAERIWNRLKLECRASNVRFEEGKKVTISWYDEISEAEFNAIVPFQTSLKPPNRKPHSIRIINLTAEAINDQLFQFSQGVGLVGNHWTYLKNKGKNIYLLKKNFKCVGLTAVRAEEGVVTYSEQTLQATFNFSVGLANN
ncbi:hypothetical protein CROQUDRAFT_46830 [Cronartium quercuum f. sp. fusiforme G11]|uniref:Uncharacterized protein n=1 Tax=Cronartium quercuum f. sp. fusiforme G11 TaxID=708437 RepID=A0A9P6TBL4_9BASI|nr:hypothetical protein CROQUDRAFT_46830 [Cronartium quercuum f. sp. fusiforme G11]